VTKPWGIAGVGHETEKSGSHEAFEKRTRHLTPKHLFLCCCSGQPAKQSGIGNVHPRTLDHAFAKRLRICRRDENLPAGLQNRDPGLDSICGHARLSSQVCICAIMWKNSSRRDVAGFHMKYGDVSLGKSLARGVW
jgi:hypothetical protein